MKRKTLRRLIRKSKPKTPRKAKKCKVCGKPMLVAKGQEAYYHKECRKLRNK